ncbi:hypothetical protein [Microbacterium paraoxydans]|uniref:Uncharacterized protein n=1 Tax=Microbacterium paraoxydans TaxID=199592 RepID=A0ABS5IKT1_9MICO|nr:hypothetical protein [Microbacterium paraoxydans]MBS0023569.1 hypothetical protein [Microbacterium paraoxydans]
MTEKTQQDAGLETPAALQPLPVALELNDAAAAGFCANGVCQLPAPPTR